MEHKAVKQKKTDQESGNKTRGKIFVISAPSGAGKTTICNRVLAEFPEIRYSVSHTTRLPRGQEKDGIDYFFITAEEFRKRIDNNLWAEWAEVHGNLYGTSREFIEDNLEKGSKLLLDIDVQGAKQFKKVFPEAITVFIMPPSTSTLEDRLRKRKTDSDDVIAQRLANAAGEMEQSSFYDYIVVNDNLERAVSEMTGIIFSARQDAGS